MSLALLFRRLILIMLGIVLSMLGSEVVVRLVRPQTPLFKSAKGHPSLNRGRFTTPGKHHHQTSEFSVDIEVNTYGFVDWNWSIPNPDATLFVGDSFVQGAQVEMEESVGRVLQELNKEPVYSIGIPGAGTTTSLLIANEWAPKIQPKKLIMGFLVSNDVLNNHSLLESKSDKPFALEINDEIQIIRKNTISYVPNFILQNSHLFRWVARGLDKKLQGQQNDTLGTPVHYWIYAPPEYPQKVSKHSEYLWTKSWIAAWDITERLVLELHHNLTTANIDFYIVLMPSLEEISLHQQQLIAKSIPNMLDWDYSTAHSRTLSMLNSVGIPESNIIDLYPHFLQHPSPNDLFYPQDKHWTPKGHLLAAQVISQRMTNQRSKAPLLEKSDPEGVD